MINYKGDSMNKSWKTAAIGYAVIILTWLQQVFVEQTIPQNSREWVSFLTKNGMGLAAILAKDWNVSNSPASVAVAPHVVDNTVLIKTDTTTSNVNTTPVIK